MARQEEIAAELSQVEGVTCVAIEDGNFSIDVGTETLDTRKGIFAVLRKYNVAQEPIINLPQSALPNSDSDFDFSIDDLMKPEAAPEAEQHPPTAA